MRLSIFLLLLFAPSMRAEPLWDLKKLGEAPKVEWLDKTGPVRSLYYESEPYQGKTTRVFAWYAEPTEVQGKLPAMVLVHGGGGTAFKEWVELWAKRGYVAIAMDLGGVGPDKKRLPDGGPSQDDGTKFPAKKTDLKEMWSYHAVANVIRANSLLRSLPNVDPERIGLTGISWGGYLTCMVSGIDDRFKVAVPVYGCGFLHENSTWLDRFSKMDPEWRKEWIANFDPSSHVKNARMPMLFVNGTNDFAYPLDSYQKTYRLVKNHTLCVTVNMPHGHSQGWTPKEIGEFVDVYLKKGKKFFPLGQEKHDILDVGGSPAVVLGTPQFGPLLIKSVQLHFTTDLKEPWQKRTWTTKDAHASSGNETDLWHVELPKDRPIVFFLTVKDADGRTVSTEHEVREK